MSDKPDDVPKYVNYAQIMHSKNEFFVDFVSLHPPPSTTISPAPVSEITSGKIAGRFVMSPSQAKTMLIALTTNVSRYEEQYGEIGVPQVHSNITLN